MGGHPTFVKRQTNSIFVMLPWSLRKIVKTSLFLKTQIALGVCCSRSVQIENELSDFQGLSTTISTFQLSLKTELTLIKFRAFQNLSWASRMYLMLWAPSSTCHQLLVPISSFQTPSDTFTSSSVCQQLSVPVSSFQDPSGTFTSSVCQQLSVPVSSFQDP